MEVARGHGRCSGRWCGCWAVVDPNAFQPVGWAGRRRRGPRRSEPNVNVQTLSASASTRLPPSLPPPPRLHLARRRRYAPRLPPILASPPASPPRRGTSTRGLQVRLIPPLFSPLHPLPFPFSLAHALLLGFERQFHQGESPRRRLELLARYAQDPFYIVIVSHWSLLIQGRCFGNFFS